MAPEDTSETERIEIDWSFSVVRGSYITQRHKFIDKGERCSA